MKRGEWVEHYGTICFVAEPQFDWAEGSELCQRGRHCRRELISVGKDAYCPFCGKGVYLT